MTNLPLTLKREGDSMVCQLCGKICIEAVTPEMDQECACEAIGIAMGIADELAFASFEGMCNGDMIDQRIWTDLETLMHNSGLPARVCFEAEIRYCELRGLLRRHPQRPSLVQRVDEDE